MQSRATVVRLEEGFAWVKLDEQAGGCGRCDEPGGCRAAQLTHAFGAPRDTFRVADPRGVARCPGQSVALAVAPGLPLRAAMLLYALPAGLLLLGAAGGQWLMGSDLAALAGGGLAMAAGFALARGRAGRRRSSFAVTLVEAGPAEPAPSCRSLQP